MRNPVLRLALAGLFCLLFSSVAYCANYCTSCGKKLLFGVGTCAACKVVKTKQTVQAVDEKYDISKKIETRVQKQVTAKLNNGKIVTFSPDRYARYSSGRDLVYINGMRTDFDRFVKDARYLANLLGRDLTAVYAGGSDRGVVSSVALQVENWTNEGFSAQMAEGKSLLKVLRRSKRAGRKVDMVCYSRGTMVTEAILSDFPWARDHITVYAFGCAVSGDFPVRSFYKIVNKDDILMKDRMLDNSIVVWGRSGGHDFYEYMDNLVHNNYTRKLPLAEDAGY